MITRQFNDESEAVGSLQAHLQQARYAAAAAEDAALAQADAGGYAFAGMMRC
jgi:hypothetical protein